jgi:phosphatidylglycerophosphatase A
VTRRAARGGAAWSLRIATLGGIGDLPLAPGTWGSLAALAAWLPTRAAFPALAWPLLAALAAVAVVTAHRAARLMGQRDPGRIVIDEAAGMALACAALPLEPAPWQAAAAFLLFRLFDVVKPWPLRRLERLPGGPGIVADDLAAGALTCLALTLGSGLNI